jgi:hypothetical protein
MNFFDNKNKILVLKNTLTGKSPLMPESIAVPFLQEKSETIKTGK